MNQLSRKKILELISKGRITGKEGVELLSVLDEKNNEQHLKLEIISSRQEIPYFRFMIALQKLSQLKKQLGMLKGNELISDFQIGRFRIDLTKLNWERILELAEIGESEELFILEMPGQEDEQITMRIYLEKT